MLKQGLIRGASVKLENFLVLGDFLLVLGTNRANHKLSIYDLSSMDIQSLDKFVFIRSSIENVNHSI